MIEKIIFFIKRVINRLRAIYFNQINKNNYNLEWNQRIRDVISSPDNKYIPRVKQAGKIQSNFQIMHNGLKIITGSYYGKGITKMLVKNKGVHEPQEERVFGIALEKMKSKSTMVELGSYWSFYSMWFLKEINDGNVYMFEPDTENLKMGELNFTLNGFNGDFNNAYIGDNVILDSTPPIINIDYIVREKKIDFIDILHSDIQGFEFDMLKGALDTIKNDLIGYFFISTHSDEIHEDCLDFLISHNYIIICEANLSHTYSVDGIIVAKSRNYPGIDFVNISQK